jgi:hypothetical protein
VLDGDRPLIKVNIGKSNAQSLGYAAAEAE